MGEAMTPEQIAAAQALWDRMDEARFVHPHGSWAQRWLPWVCKHECTRCVHGDEIIARGFRRVACLCCGRSLDRGLPPDCWFSRTPHPSVEASDGA